MIRLIITKGVQAHHDSAAEERRLGKLEAKSCYHRYHYGPPVARHEHPGSVNMQRKAANVNRIIQAKRWSRTIKIHRQ